MKNAHILSTSTDAESPKDPNDGVIRLKIDKPSHWDWQLTTSSDTIPKIQLLDKDGRLLVETTTGIAQRAKGSFRDGLKTYEEFSPTPTSSSSKTSIIIPGNRNFEGYSTKFDTTHFSKPRKSRSDIDLRNGGGGRRARKRNSSIDVSCRSEGGGKKYSPGDYLRQQIVDEIWKNIEGRTEDEIARDRCDKVRVYLRNKSDSSFNRESRGRWRNEGRRRVDRSLSGGCGSLGVDREERAFDCGRRCAFCSGGDASSWRGTTCGSRDASFSRGNAPNCREDAPNNRNATDVREDAANNRNATDGREDAANSRENAPNCIEDVPNNRKASNSREDAANSGGNAPNCREDAVNSRGYAPNCSEDASNNRNATYGREDVPNNREDEFSSRRAASSSRRDTSSNRREASNNRRDVSSSRRDVSSSTRDVSSSRRDFSNSRDAAHSRRDSSNSRDAAHSRRDSSNTRDAAYSRRSTTNSRETVFNSRRDFSNAKGDASNSRSNATSSSENASNSGSYSSNSRREDYGEEDASNGTKDAPNSRRVAASTLRDVSHSTRDSANRRRCASNTRDYTSSTKRDISYSRRDSSYSRRGSSNSRESAPNSREDVPNIREDVPNINEDVPNIKDAPNSRRHSRRDATNNRRIASNRSKSVTISSNTPNENENPPNESTEHPNNPKSSSPTESNTPKNSQQIFNDHNLPSSETNKPQQKSETPIPKFPFPQRTVNSYKTGKQLSNNELEKIRYFLQDRISAKMNEEKLLFRSRSQPIPTTNTFPNDIETEKRYSNSSLKRDYQIRKVGSDASVVRFFERQHQPCGSRQNFQQESTTIPRRKLLRSRTRNDALLETDELENIYRDKKPVHRQKFYTRKTKSDTPLSNFHQNPDNLESRFQEYRDRKKLDSKLDKLDSSDLEEEDFMKKPRWKDLQFETCTLTNCTICQNLKNCINPLASNANSMNQISNNSNSTNSNHSYEQSKQIPDDINAKPKTSLQENYLVLERATSPQHDSIISETTTNSREEEEEISSSSWNSPDFGYNTISKQSRDCKKVFNPSSTVKKSDTFKIVDGSENTGIKKSLKTECFDTVTNNNKNNSKSNKNNNSNNSNNKNNSDNNKNNSDNKNNSNNNNNNNNNNDNKNNNVGDNDENYQKEGLNRQTNQEIAEDYFLRVYEILKKRKEEVRQLAQLCDSSEFERKETETMKTKRRRRKKILDSQQDEENEPSISTEDKEKSTNNSSHHLLNGIETNDNNNKKKVENVPENRKRRQAPKAPKAPKAPFSNNTYVIEKINEKSSDYPSERSKSRHDINELGLPEEGGLLHPPSSSEMGSNLSRHSAGKGLTGRRTQSSGNLCDAKGKLNSVGKIFVPCSSTSRESRYKFCGSLPNHLDDKEGLEIESGENNNVIHSDVGGNLPGTLPHQKKLAGLQLSDSDPPFGTFDLVRRPSQDSLEGDPWRYRLSDEFEPGKCQLHSILSSKNSKGTDSVDSSTSSNSKQTKKRFSFSKTKEKILNRHENDSANRGTSSFKETRRDSMASNKKVDEIDNYRQRRLSSKNSSQLDSTSMVHKPNCQLVKHRLQSALSLDLTLSKLCGNEPQDQGYASERSPEDEQPPSLPGQDDIFPNVTPENTFRVVLEKNNRGLGLSVSGGGTAGPVRVKRLFPQQPAALSHKLEQGDILLAANGIPLTGLTNYEALEVLRTTSNKVELVVCRLPSESTGTSPDIPLPPPPPPVRREPPPPLRILNPLPPLQIEPCGEFDIEMTKVSGSLGFTLRKADSSALGHYIRALVREPALSDGRIRPGDKIVAVDGAPLSPMSHEEAVALLRQCGPKVKLRLYRDLAQTPVSALSPTEPDHPLRPPRTSLRQEAVDMLCDLAVRKLSPGPNNNGSNDSNRSTSGSYTSPRKLRRPAPRTPSTEADNGNIKRKLSSQMSSQSQGDTSESDQCSIKTQITNSQVNTPSDDIIIDPPLFYDVDSYDSLKISRPSFLDLSAPQDKPNFQFNIKSESKSTNRAGGDNNNSLNIDGLSCDELDGNLPSEPASMPPVSTTNNDATFSHKNPAYQSANPSSNTKDITKSKVSHSSDQDIPGKVFGNEDPGGSKGLLKWKGVMFAPDDEESENKQNGSVKETLPVTCAEGDEVFMVELTRGWNSRLGFSLQPNGNQTVISVVHPDSVAAKDGRLKEGDVLIMINDESVEEMSTADIIDLLRKVRGAIGITVLRQKKQRLKT
ncbi:uncharacterized protein LOC122498592 [Leptopilina heterotoma]|uniref:uncharacterized protein LOC122498592 n=1 Tax=Leptopilina heterotoma TaxID=63436 RepID=UPI001CA94E7D|nr:uncharacterized protein LOC122498592 [Leptopilina heterotoma]